MMCEKCGKKVANYHYMSNINGKVTEQHLCADCAAELQGRENVFAGVGSMFENMLGDFFGGGLESFMRPAFGGFFGMPAAGMPRIGFMTGAEPETETREESGGAAEAADPEMARQREINMLREQISQAVANEEYEKAAELRDKIRAIEKK